MSYVQKPARKFYMAECVEAVLSRLVYTQRRETSSATFLPPNPHHQDYFSGFLKSPSFTDVCLRVRREYNCTDPSRLEHYFRGLVFEKVAAFVVDANNSNPNTVILSATRTLLLWKTIHPESYIVHQPLGLDSLSHKKRGRGIWVPDGAAVANGVVTRIHEASLSRDRLYYITKIAHILEARARFLREQSLEVFTHTEYDFLAPCKKDDGRKPEISLPGKYTRFVDVVPMPFNRDQFATFVGDIIKDTPTLSKKLHPKKRSKHYLS